jgi:enoyl-CoA hydratase/carnithine racemase
MAEVLLSEQTGAVLRLTMNRPETKNALTPELLQALKAGLDRAAQDASVRAIVLTGAGGAFCSGVDLKEAMVSVQAGVDLNARMDDFHNAIRAVIQNPKPVIAAVDGAAVGFGADLALACDLRVMSDSAYIQEKFVGIGLMPDGGGTFWLPRLVGVGRALEFLMLGTRLDAARCLELGLTNRVVAQAEIVAGAEQLAAELAKGPPLALANIKRAVRASLSGDIESALSNERAGQLGLLRSQDLMEGVMAWMQKRPPAFTGK